MKSFYITICFIVFAFPVVSTKALAQTDSGQDVYDARQAEINDQDRWSDLETIEYCKTHQQEKGCFKTKEQIRKQKQSDIIVPVVLLGVFFGGLWIAKKIKNSEENGRNRKNG